ncbi:glycosyltransferase family 87 protein [Tuwongella immobilis]|uniref:Uncharacterized protein n=1 Tax=Tuwongella immobilis TaxID=692036 RepID=A0A6C2YJ63_9BACT|nr:glycosyltransferase family 87 protein [Tuwongella immobilis]VIP01321.1 Uncharacterized protein OS=Cystobacter fuscus DSM 2262 GN=D187_008862 PE=4 SV=1: DUF2029 [Tuwongella immobilis]VTR98068.1 Uncharacterized protein OS=Cystobacter fuscus DSM 2262 GN=D187_008862 PE=4 SV=1: DUF2029 [Tuwongella immobilis]
MVSIRSCAFTAMACILWLLIAPRISFFDRERQLALMLIAFGMLIFGRYTGAEWGNRTHSILRIGILTTAVFTALSHDLPRLSFWSPDPALGWIARSIYGVTILRILIQPPTLITILVSMVASGLLLSVETSIFFYPGMRGAHGIIQVSAILGQLWFLWATWSDDRILRRRGLTIAGIIALGVWLRIATPLITAKPEIDVYYLIVESSLAIAQGNDPYDLDVTNIYYDPKSPDAATGDPPMYRPAGYPPLPYLLGVPLVTAGIDYRVLLVIADIAAALMLTVLAYRRQPPQMAFLISTAYWLMPRCTVLIENCWYEPVIIALLTGGLWLIESGYRIGYGLIGLALTGKQYGIFLILPLFVALPFWPLIIGTTIAAVVTIGPFLAWNADGMFTSMLRKHLDRPIQAQFLGMPSLFARLEIPFPRSGYFVCQLLCMGWLCARSWLRIRSPLQVAGLIGSVILMFSFWNIQAAINYFQVTVYFWLLAAAVDDSAMQDSLGSAPDHAASVPGPAADSAAESARV